MDNPILAKGVSLPGEWYRPKPQFVEQLLRLSPRSPRLLPNSRVHLDNNGQIGPIR
jgi:hypothetical protein